MFVNSQEPKKTKLELSGLAFDDEKIEVDKVYSKYMYKRTIVICGTILIIFATLIILYIWQNQTIAIDLTGQTTLDATSWLDKQNINYQIVEDESNSIQAGKVIKQSIPSGEKIGKTDLQTITISSGPNMKEIVSLKELDGKS